jgi:transcriptional regulator with XRE-family HTH domain
MPTKTVSSAFQTVAANLEALRAHYPSLSSQAAIGRAAKVDQKTVGRILNMTNEPSLEVLAKIAKVFGLEPWQLMLPGLDVNEPQRLVSSRDAERLDKIRDALSEPPAQSHESRAPGLHNSVEESVARIAGALPRHDDFGSPHDPKETNAARDTRKRKGQ